MNNGFELPLLYAISAVGVSLTGPGSISLDAAFGLTFFNHPFIVASALVLALIGAVVTLALRTNPETQKLATQN